MEKLDMDDYIFTTEDVDFDVRRAAKHAKECKCEPWDEYDHYYSWEWNSAFVMEYMYMKEKLLSHAYKNWSLLAGKGY